MYSWWLVKPTGWKSPSCHDCCIGRSIGHVGSQLGALALFLPRTAGSCTAARVCTGAPWGYLPMPMPPCAAVQQGGCCTQPLSRCSCFVFPAYACMVCTASRAYLSIAWWAFFSTVLMGCVPGVRPHLMIKWLSMTHWHQVCCCRGCD